MRLQQTVSPMLVSAADVAQFLSTIQHSVRFGLPPARFLCQVRDGKFFLSKSRSSFDEFPDSRVWPSQIRMLE